MADHSPVRVGLLGFGTVGAGTYQMLVDNDDEIQRKIGRSIVVQCIGVRDLGKKRELPSDRFTADLNSIVSDPSVDVVLELIGGESPAAELVEKALESGKHVVTANKELIAKHGSRLITLAHSRGLDLHFEAAVGGGIPIVQPLKHQLAGNDIEKMMGVLNGTSNYVLTKMHRDGMAFDEALEEAQEKGYAEADPSGDVDGLDTKYKIAILAAIAFGKQAPLDAVHCEGIRSVGARDMHYADVLGYRIKLLGICEETGAGKIMIRVHPTLVPNEHPLANVEDVYNALWVHGDFAGDVMFSGKGAGSFPTASAVVGDLIDCARNMAADGSGSAIPYGIGMNCAPISELQTRYYIRMVVVDKPNTLGAISTLFGEAAVGLAAMEMRTLENDRGEIVFLTHRCLESDFVRALAEVRELPVVHSVESWFRVEE